MSLTLRTITNAGAPLYAPDGTLLANTKITFALVDSSGKQTDAIDAITNERVGGYKVTAMTDELGEFAVGIWPNRRGNRTTWYLCQVDRPGFRDVRGIVEDVPQPLSWVAFLTSGAAMTPQEISQLAQYLAGIEQAKADAIAAAAEAEAAAAAAAASAAAAGGGGGGIPTGPAGGVLSGTYPNPGFAVAMATQAALDAHTSDTSNPHGVSKYQVGLGNVDNTSDSAKSVASAAKLTTARTINGVEFDGTSNITINAADATARIASSEKGAANGVATLGADGKVPAIQLPSYVDDVIEAETFASLPAIGEPSKIYVVLDTVKIYRWSGSAYIEISPTSGTADAATRLATARTISATGDATWSVSFDGSADVSSSLTLADVATAGTYRSVSVNAKGLVTAGTNPTTLAEYGITDAASSVHSHTLSNITDASDFGRSLVAAADAPAATALLGIGASANVGIFTIRRAGNAHIAGGVNVAGTVNSATVANRQYFIPIIYQRELTIKQLQAVVATGAAGILRIGIYDSQVAVNGDTIPGALIAGGAALDTSTATTLTDALAQNITMLPNTLYWASLITSATPSIKWLGSTGVQSFFGYQYLSQIISHLFANGSGGEMPVNAPANLQIGTGNIPIIGLIEA